MDMRQSRRLKAHASARLQLQRVAWAGKPYDSAWFTDDGDDGGIGPCSACDGDGRDPMTDYILEREGW